VSLLLHAGVSASQSPCRRVQGCVWGPSPLYLVLKKFVAKMRQIQGRVLRGVTRRDAKGGGSAVWKRGLINSGTRGNERDRTPFTSSVSSLIFLMHAQDPRLAESLGWPGTAVLLLWQSFQWLQVWKKRSETPSCTRKGIFVLPAGLVLPSGSAFVQVLSFPEVWKTSCRAPRGGDAHLVSPCPS